MRVVFQSGQSLKDLLVSSSFASPDRLREVYRRKAKRRGRPVECRACDVGMSDGPSVYVAECGLFDALFRLWRGVYGRYRAMCK